MSPTPTVITIQTPLPVSLTFDLARNEQAIVRITVSSGATARVTQPNGGLQTLQSSDGILSVPVVAPLTDDPPANEYKLTVINTQGGMTSGGTIRVKPKGKDDDDEMFAADNG